jgi:hypothetical protein
MKIAAATSILFATIALASPAPVAQPNAIAKPMVIESRPQLHSALAAREPAQLEARKVKGGKGGDGNSTESAASDLITPSRALQLGALGLGVMEVARLWA